MNRHFVLLPPSHSSHPSHFRTVVPNNPKTQAQRPKTMSFNPASDVALVADGLENVWLVRQGSPPGATGTPLPYALRGKMTTREAAVSEGQYTAADVVWRVPVDGLDTPPQPGDVVRDAADVCYTILAARPAPLGAGWRLVTRRLAIVPNLANRISILRAAYSKGAGGAAVATWTTWQADVPARIQPHETASATDAAALRMQARFLVFVAAAIDVDEHCRIADAEGRHYRIMSITRAERLDELMTLEVEAL